MAVPLAGIGIVAEHVDRIRIQKVGVDSQDTIGMDIDV